jgi:hypothetical protein
MHAIAAFMKPLATSRMYIGTYFYPYFVMEANLVKYVLKWFSGVRKEDYSIFLNTHNKSTNVYFPPPLPHQ